MKRRTENGLLFVALIICILVWPWVFYARPSPAFGGESVLVLATLTGYITNKLRKE